MICPPCKGTGKSPSNRTSHCLCCKGKKEITQEHFNVLQTIGKDIQLRLKAKQSKANKETSNEIRRCIFRLRKRSSRF